MSSCNLNAIPIRIRIEVMAQQPYKDGILWVDETDPKNNNVIFAIDGYPLWKEHIAFRQSTPCESEAYRTNSSELSYSPMLLTKDFITGTIYDWCDCNYWMRRVDIKLFLGVRAGYEKFGSGVEFDIIYDL